MRTRIQVETSFFMNEEFNPSSFNHEEQYLKKRFEELNLEVVDFSNEKFEQNKESIELILNKITNGKFTDKSYGNHIVNAFDKEKERLEFSNKTAIERQKYILDTPLDTSNLFMSFGHSDWIDKNTDLVVFFSNTNPEFKKIIELDLAQLSGIDIEKVPLEEISQEKIVPIAKSEDRIFTFKIERDLKNKGSVDFMGEFYGGTYFEGAQAPNVQMYGTFLYCLLNKIPITDNFSNGAFLWYFDEIQEVYEKRFNKKLSFGSMADTIVDLKSKKMYRYKG